MKIDDYDKTHAVLKKQKKKNHVSTYDMCRTLWSHPIEFITTAEQSAPKIELCIHFHKLTCAEVFTFLFYKFLLIFVNLNFKIYF